MIWKIQYLRKKGL